ncbi:hypothetical protein [Thiolapillus sp.]|uniref:hypothetical protein n=1 Tax=Thiolapillus sp. TaxID=2017437 RepID=UPI003AF4DEA0
MTRTAGAPIGCQRPSRFWGLGCPKIYHEAEDTLALLLLLSTMMIVLLPMQFASLQWASLSPPLMPPK